MQDGFWEAKWYSRGDGTFRAADVNLQHPDASSDDSKQLADIARVGFVICSELWFFEHSRHLGKQVV